MQCATHRFLESFDSDSHTSVTEAKRKLVASDLYVLQHKKKKKKKEKKTK